MFIILGVIGILLALGFVIWGGISWYNARKNGDNPILGISLFFGSIALLIVSILVPFSIRQVETTEIAVVKEWGNAVDTRNAGIHFDFWISKSYVKIETTTQEINEVLPAYSLDGQTMNSSFNVQYRIQKEKGVNIINEFGSLENLQAKITSLTIEKAKVVMSAQSAMDIIATRNELSGKLEQSMKLELDKYYVDLILVVITNIDFSDTFEKVIEEKMIAEQEKIKAEFEKERAIIKAEEELEVAKLDAEKALAKAEGEAKAIQEIATAQANAIKIKSIETARMLGFKITKNVIQEEGQSYIEYDIDFEGKTIEEINSINEYIKYIEYLSVWNGELPTVMTGDGASIIVPMP